MISTSATDLAWARWLIVGATLAAALGLVLASNQRVRRDRRHRRGGRAAAGAGLLVGADARARDELDVPRRRPGVRADDGRRAGGRGGGRRRGAAAARRRPATPRRQPAPQAVRARRRDVRRRHVRGHLRADLHQGQRRRHARDLEPVRRGQSIIASGADVAALGGFSGSETTVTIDWLADTVEPGKIRWIIVSSTATGMSDGRAGATGP